MQDYQTVGGKKVYKKDFGYAPGDEPSKWKFPLDTEGRVRDAMARFNQEKGIPAGAMRSLYHKILERAHGYKMDTSNFEKEHGGRFKASEEPRIYVELAELDLSEGQVRMPIALTGQWVKNSGQKIAIDDAVLGEIRNNFSKEPNGVNVDYDHASESELLGLLGPSPSAGKLVKLDEPEEFGSTGRRILWGYYEPTDRARQLIKSREYRGVSAAMGKVPDRSSGKPQGWTLTSVALTNRPVLRELPEIRLSEDGAELMDSGAVEIPGNISSPQSAGKGGSKLKNFKVKKLADGEHRGKWGVYDGADGGPLVGVADVEPDADDKQKASEQLLSEIGAPGKSIAEVKAIVEGRQAEGSEAALLSDCVTAEGKLDRVKLANLLDSGKLKPSAQLRATDAESRAAEAFRSGRVHPENRQHALRLLLSDEGAFKAFVEDAKPAIDLSEQGTAGGAGNGQANLAWQQQLEKKASALLNEKRASSPEHALQLAERELVSTEDGLRLYELARKERLEEAEKAQS